MKVLLTLIVILIMGGIVYYYNKNNKERYIDDFYKVEQMKQIKGKYKKGSNCFCGLDKNGCCPNCIEKERNFVDTCIRCSKKMMGCDCEGNNWIFK
jgi:hypothetical protein